MRPVAASSGARVVERADGQRIYQRVVRYHRLPSQKCFDELRATFKGFSGPIGSGKSKALCMEAIRCAYLNPGVLGLIGAPTYRILADSTQLELLGSLEEHHIPFRYHKSEKLSRVIEPGSDIILRTLDEPERLRAMNLGWFGVDELTYCKQDAWQRLEGRLRHPGARYKCGFAVWTPKGKDWVWKRFISAHKLAGYEVVQAKPYENYAILNVTPDFYRRLEHSYDERLFKQEVLGEYLDLYSGSVYHAFSPQNVRPGIFDPRRVLMVSFDFNVNPMTAILAQSEEIAGTRTFHVLDEIVLPASHTVEMCQEFIRRTRAWAETAAESGNPLRLDIYGDATGGATSPSSAGESNWSIIRKFLGSQEDYRAKFLHGTKNPAISDRVNAVNGALCSFGEGHHRAGQRHLFIDPKASELIADLEEVRWKVDAHGTARQEIDKTNPQRTHTSDALGYMIWTECGERRTVRTLREPIG